MKKEIRKLIAVKLLDWSFSIMPDCRFKNELARLMSDKLLDGIDNTKNIPILPNYCGGYRLEYDGKYITLYGKDKRYKSMFGDGYEEMVLIPIVEEIRNAAPEITKITEKYITIYFGK